jgi:hypothetical protein
VCSTGLKPLAVIGSDDGPVSPPGRSAPTTGTLDRIPPGLADTATTQRIDDVLALRGLVEELDAAELPRGFGRD